MTFENLNARVKTSLLLAAVVITAGAIAAYGCVGKWLMALLLAAATLGCALEFSRICSNGGAQRFKQALYFVVLMLPAAALFGAFAWLGLCGRALEVQLAVFCVMGGLVLAGWAALIYLAVSGRACFEAAVKIGQELMIGLFLIGLGGAMFMLLPVLKGSVLYFFWLLLVVCCNDIAAYFMGSRLKGPLLAPALSPGKTISGSIGGLCGGLIAGFCAWRVFGFNWGWPQTLGLVVAVVLAAQAGDLAKSLLKRLSGVKDSGTMLPGHGGMLDRLDGLFAAAPLMVIFLEAVG